MKSLNTLSTAALRSLKAVECGKKTLESSALIRAINMELQARCEEIIALNYQLIEISGGYEHAESTVRAMRRDFAT